MKKFLAMLLTLVMMLSFASCTNDTTSDSSSDKKKDGETKEKVAFEEVVVVDNDECVIKITGEEEDDVWGYTLKAYLENKSDEKTYMFSVTDASVNSVQTDPFFATEVAAGKKANEEITFSDENLKENGITEYTDIELSFKVYDSDDWTAVSVAEETVHIYPYGEDNAEVFEREIKDTDNVIIDNEYVTAVVTGYEEDEIWGYTANLYLVNKTDSDVMFAVEDASVNGFMADPFFATDIYAGKSKFSSISWNTETLEENDITEVEEIELAIRVYDSDDWTRDDLANEKVVLNP